MLQKLFFIYDQDEEIRLKNIIMSKSEIPSEAINFKDVYIFWNKNEYIHTVIIKDDNFENKKDMVFIHGLAGSSVCYYGLFRDKISF